MKRALAKEIVSKVNKGEIKIVTQKDIEQTVVIFRKWKKSFDEDMDIVALFPYEKYSDSNPSLCMSYAHIGQHGGADYWQCVKNSKLATPEEYADLKQELEEIGYNLKVAKKKQYGKVKKAIDKILGIC